MTINMARSTETKEVGLSIGLCVGSTTKVRNISHHPTPTLNFFYPRDSTGTSTHPLVDPRGKVMDGRNPQKAQKGPVETFSLIGWYTRWSDVEIMRWRSRILSTVCQTFRAECLTRRPTVDQRISQWPVSPDSMRSAISSVCSISLVMGGVVREVLSMRLQPLLVLVRFQWL